MKIPDWVPDSIFYQIFPDRFANGDPDNDPPNVQAWGEKPTRKGFQGGDLQGILQHFDYLLDLGVNAIYLNPIFQSTSNHKYNTSDYYRIDPKLGTFDDFQDLLNLAHNYGVKVILDGVFNHCGRSFFAFQDVLENSEHSGFKNWFHIHRFPVCAYGEEKAKDYEAWWGFRSLPKLNTDNPEVRRYIFGVARYWIEQGADGWRLDVPNEIDDDSFWGEFREVVRNANPEAYLVGEIWEPDARWVGESHFDGLMNYPLRDALLDFVVDGSITASRFAQRLEGLLSLYPEENNYAHMLTLGSHDTERLLTRCKGDAQSVRLMNLVQFFFPGAPHIYYGDEVGLEGRKDPDCRRAFPWDEQAWDQEHRTFVKKLIQARHQYRQLRRGDFKRLLVDDDQQVVAFTRSIDEDHAVLFFNASEVGTKFSVPLKDLELHESMAYVEVLRNGQLSTSGDRLEIQLPSRSGTILVNKRVSISV